MMTIPEALPSRKGPSYKAGQQIGSYPTVHLVFVHGFRGDHTSFQRFPTDLHQYLSPRIPSLMTHVYPTYKSKKPLDYAVQRLMVWMNTLESGYFILLGVGSLGGFLVAEAAMAYAKNSPTPNMLGFIAFDVPYLGIHPHVVVSGIASLLPSKDGATEKDLNDRSKVNMVDAAQTESILDDSNVRFPTPRLNISIFGSRSPIPVPDLTPGPTAWQNTVHFFKKHAGDPLGAVKDWTVHHWEHGSMLLDLDGLKERYRRIERWEGQWVNFYTETVPKTSAPPGTNTFTPEENQSGFITHPASASTTSLPLLASSRDSILSRPSSALEHPWRRPSSSQSLDHRSQGNPGWTAQQRMDLMNEMSSSKDRIDSSPDIVFPVPHHYRTPPVEEALPDAKDAGPELTATSGSDPATSPSPGLPGLPTYHDSHSIPSSSSAKSMQSAGTRDTIEIVEEDHGTLQIPVGYPHPTGHDGHDQTLSQDPTEVRLEPAQALEYASDQGRESEGSKGPRKLKKKRENPNDQVEKKPKRPSPPRRFIVLPYGSFSSSMVKWERVPVSGSKHEVEAHTGLFFKDQNLEYDGFVERVGDTIITWCRIRSREALYEG